jgi:cyclohexanecarboxylate-CoA ligase
VITATRPPKTVDADSRPVDPRDLPGNRLRALAREHANGIAVVDDVGQTTWSGLLGMVGRERRALEQLGVGPGVVVACQLPNCVEFSAVALAVWDLGAVIVPIVPIYRDGEVSLMCQDSSASVLVVPGDGTFSRATLAERVSENLPGLRVRTITLGDRANLMAPASPAYQPGSRHPALVMFTSGTESRPKGAVHSLATLIVESESMIKYLQLSDDDVFFMPSPMAHITGLLNGVVTPLRIGATVVVQAKWNAERGLEAIAEHGCTYSVLATPFLQQMFALPEARNSLATIRYFRCGGADIPATLVQDGESLGVTILRVYGLSEFPTVSCTLPTDAPEIRRWTDGGLMTDVEVRIVDDLGNVQEPGVVGHVLASGPELFLGYVDPEITARSVTDDGFLRTGDLGVFDSAGHLTITGRAKDIIVRGGENLSAHEIEDALRTDPRIADVAVVGVPDPVMGQRACAFVIPAEPDDTPDVQTLIAAIRTAGLAPQKAPEHLRIVAEFPRTAAGKVRKEQLRQDFVVSA